MFIALTFHLFQIPIRSLIFLLGEFLLGADSVPSALFRSGFLFDACDTSSDLSVSGFDLCSLLKGRISEVEDLPLIDRGLPGDEDQRMSRFQDIAMSVLLG